MTDPTTDCPACPACGSEVGTPVVDCGGELTTDRTWGDERSGPAPHNVWCPACGFCWHAEPAALARARRALCAYYEQEGWHGGHASYVPPPPPPDPRQLTLGGTA